MRTIAFSLLATGIILSGNLAMADLCEKCSKNVYTTDIGQCTSCGGTTTSIAFKLCEKCSKKKHQCQNCLASIVVVDDDKKTPEDEKTPEKGPSQGRSAKRIVAMVTLTEADRGKTVKIAVGQMALLSLEGNATTGFQWSVEKLDGDAIRQEGKAEYRLKKNTPGLVGVGGVYVFHFSAVKSGKALLKLTYARPWEKNTPPAKTFELQFDVTK
jgi:inhibitor of cysteine peptidase